MVVGERLYGVPQHEDEVVFKHHESPNGGEDCGSTECGTIRLNHYWYFWRLNHVMITAPKITSSCIEDTTEDVLGMCSKLGADGGAV